MKQKLLNATWSTFKCRYWYFTFKKRREKSQVSSCTELNHDDISRTIRATYLINMVMRVDLTRNAVIRNSAKTQRLRKKRQRMENCKPLDVRFPFFYIVFVRRTLIILLNFVRVGCSIFL